jgi:hypothetical protein
MNRRSDIKDLTGQTFGKWRVLSLAPKTGHGHYTVWLCECSCSKKTIRPVSTTLLREKPALGCGCGRIRTCAPYRHIYDYFSKACLARSKVNSISFEQFLEFTKITSCHYCGSRIEWTEFRRPHGKHSARIGPYNLDCKDNSIGYTVDNVVVCCKRCNYAKGIWFTYDEFVEIGKAIAALPPRQMATPFLGSTGGHRAGEAATCQ